MGQGIRSTLAAAVADELGADWARVRIVQADGDEPAYGSQNTDGSHSVTDFLTPLREMGADRAPDARSRRGDQVGRGRPPTSGPRRTRSIHPASGRRLGFGALVETARARCPCRRRNG